MGIVEKIVNIFKTEQTQNRDILHYSWDDEVQEEVSRDDISTYLELYQRLIWVFVGVNEISRQLASVPFGIWKDKDKVSHPLEDLLYNPNKIVTRFKLFEKTFAYLELAGNCYWFIEREGNKPIKLHIPRPDSVRVELSDEYSGSCSYIYTGEEWDMEDVVHFSQFNPVSTTQGYPTTGALEDTAILELYEIVYGQSWYKNAIKPSLLFRSREGISDAEYERFLAAIRRVHQGMDNFHNVDLISGDVDQLPLTTSKPTDGEYVKIRQMNREETLGGLGCYHLIAMFQESGQIDEYKRMFWESMLPKLINVQETITKELLHLYPSSDKLEAKYDIRKISGLRASLLEETLAYTRLWQLGAVTSNEVREETGRSGKLDWGDEPPPSIPFSRSKYVGNEERLFTDNIQPHPESVNDLAEGLASKLSNNGNKKLIKSVIVNELRDSYYAR